MLENKVERKIVEYSRGREKIQSQRNKQVGKLK
jgi:hypothetical protein